MNLRIAVLVLIALFLASISVQAVIYNSCPTDDTLITEDTNFVGLTQCNVTDALGDGILIVNANNVTLDCGGMTLTGDGTGIGIYNSGYTNLTIRNCDINYYSPNIYIASSDTILIDKVEVRNSTGPYAGAGLAFFDTSNVEIKDSNFFDNNATDGRAIYLGRISTSSYSYNIHDNNFSYNYYGISLDFSGGNIEIHDNFFSNNMFYDVWLNSVDMPSKVYNNTFYNSNDYTLTAYDANVYNNVFQNILNDSNGEVILLLRNLDNNYFVHDNNIFAVGAGTAIELAGNGFNVYNNFINDSKYGIRINRGDYSTIYNNMLSSTVDNSIGIYVFGDATNNNIFDNNVTGFTYSVKLEGFIVGFPRPSHFNPKDNLIYNNYFDSNAAVDYTSIVPFPQDNWNSSYDCSSPNIVGGKCKGGNYWVYYQGKDVTGDGIGDTSIVSGTSTDVRIGSQRPDSGVDALPLTNNVDLLTVTITEPSNNSTQNSSTVNIEWTSNYPDNVVSYWFKVGDNAWEELGLVNSTIYSLPASMPLPFTQTFYVRAVTRDPDYNAEASVRVIFVSPTGSNLSCFDLNGFICGVNEFCPGTLISSTDANCCNVQCESVLPDLIVEDMQLNRMNDSLIVSVKIKNIGNGNANAFNVDLRKDSVSGELLGEQRVEGLNAGNQITIDFTIPMEKLNLKNTDNKEITALFAPAIVFVVVIDPLNEVMEASKLNSIKEFYFESLPTKVMPTEEKEITVRTGKYSIFFKKDLFLNSMQTFTVVDETGKAVQNALIEVVGLIAGITDSQGVWRFKALKDGVFTVKVIIDGKEVFRDSIRVHDILLKLNKRFFVENEIIKIEVIDSIDFKPLSNVEVRVLSPSGKSIILTTNNQGIISFNAIEVGEYKASISFASIEKTINFSVSSATIISSALNFVFNFLFSTNEFINLILLSILFLLSLVAFAYAFMSFNLLSRKVFGIKILEEQKIKYMLLTKTLFALLIFFIPLLVAYYSLPGFGIVVALIEVIFFALLRVILSEKKIESL